MTWHDDAVAGPNSGGPLLFGVCYALGVRLGVNPRWFRVAFLVLAAASGIGIVAYVVTALVLPRPSEAGLGWTDRLKERVALMADGFGLLRGYLTDILRNWRDRRLSPQLDVAVTAILAGAAIIIGAFVVLHSFGLLGWLTWTRTFGILLLLGGIALLRRR